MSILLIFQAAWIVQHLILYPIDTNIIISHIFHSHSLTLCYILILFTVPPKQDLPFSNSSNFLFFPKISLLFFFLLTFRYHIPRSYLNYGEENTLILFEKFGGTPLDIDI